MSNFCANGIFHMMLTFITFNRMQLLSSPDIKMESYLDLNGFNEAVHRHYTTQPTANAF